jgi:LysR family transcriptional regulator, transcriptional activator of the cysJI operon
LNLTAYSIDFTYDTLGSLVNAANLRLIRDVAQHRSVSKAARWNDLSQSAASQALSELERELGVTLFDRATRPLGVTPAGEVYLEYCRDILRRHDEMLAALDNVKKQVNGTARIAAIYSVGLSEMSEIEARFAERFGDAELQVQYLRPDRVWQAVQEDEADLGLMSYAESSRDMVALPWRDEEMVIAVAPDDPLSMRSSAGISALQGKPFVAFDEDLPIQQHIDRYLREHKVEINISLRFDNIEMIKQAVAHGAGVSIMPERVMREDMLQGRLMALRLEPAELFRPVRIVHRRKKVFNEVTAGLLELLREEEPSRG